MGDSPPVKNYTVIENTPGHLPDDDDPPTFDSYAEALYYLVGYNKELSDMSNFDTPMYEVGPIENGWFKYYTLPKTEHSLPRHVEIVPLEAE